MTDADEDVLEPMTVRIGVMDFVGDRGRQADLLGQRRQLRDEPVVVGLKVMAQLDVEVAVGEVDGPRFRYGASRLAVAAEQEPSHLAVATAGEAEEMAARLVERRLDQPALEDRELLLTRQVATTRQAGEGGVAVDVACQKNEVVAGDRAGVMLTGPAATRLSAPQRVVELAAA